MTLDTFDPMACLSLSDEEAELALVEEFDRIAVDTRRERQRVRGCETLRDANGHLYTRKHWSQWA